MKARLGLTLRRALLFGPHSPADACSAPNLPAPRLHAGGLLGADYQDKGGWPDCRRIWFQGLGVTVVAIGEKGVPLAPDWEVYNATTVALTISNAPWRFNLSWGPAPVRL